MSRIKPVPERTAGKKQVKQVIKKSATKPVQQHFPLFERIDKFLSDHLTAVFWISFGLTLLSGVLLFDIRVSPTGDDSAYIIRGADFIRHFIFPSFQGPLYPIVISPLIGIFGIRVVALKFLSLIFMLGFAGFTYKAFKNRIPAFLLAGVLLLVAVNSYILYYASQTYSEAMFMLIQAMTFLVFFKFFLNGEKETSFLKFSQRHIILALCVLALALTRSIGFAAVFAISGYFMVKGQWRNLAGFFISFLLIFIVFEIIKFLVWGTNDFNFSDQVRSLLSKDYYNPAVGNENVAGFIHRFLDNSNLFLSNYFYSMIGIPLSDEAFKVYPPVMVLTYLMLLASVVFAFRRNNSLLFTGIWLFAFLLITFLIAHSSWKQSRFIIPYIPLMLIELLALLYFIFSLKSLSLLKMILPVVVIILFVLSIRTTVPQVMAARQVTDRYYGLTPGWGNYCRISEWVSVNLPEEAVVACRKPSVSFIYSNGRRFYGITRIPSYPVDSSIMTWQKKKLHYYLISDSSIKTSPVSRELYYTFKNSVIAYGINNQGERHNVKFYIMDFPESIRFKTLSELNKLKIMTTDDYGSLKKIMDEPGSGISIIYPDSLLRMLYKAKVTHVLTANLHSYMTVERMMSYIEFKYPNIKTRTMQIGSEDNEPACIYKLNYDQAGLKPLN